MQLYVAKPQVQVKWLAFIAAGIMIILANLDMTIINLALAEMARFFKSDLSDIQWVLNSYLLATVFSFVIFGKLADRWGRKKIFLAGIFLFTVASFWAGITNHLTILLLARFIQGLGFAATLGLSVLIIVNVFPKHEAGFATGMAVMLSGLAQAAGPTLGGLILQYSDWHWIFLINVPLGVISLLMTASFIDAGQPGNTLRQRQPALARVALFKNRRYLTIIGLRFTFMLVMSSILLLTPLYLQNILNFSALKSGLILLSMTLFIAIAAPLTGKLIDKIGFAQPLALSFLLAFISMLTMIFFNTSAYLTNIIASFILFGLAVGLQTAASLVGALAQVPQQKSGMAIGLFFTVALSGAIVGVSLSSTFISWWSSHSLLPTSGLTSQQFSQLLVIANGSMNAKYFATQIPEFYTNLAQQAFVNALHSEVAVLACMMLGAFLLSMTTCIRYKKTLGADQ